MNPLELPGPQFLRFYAILFVTVVLVAILLRRLLRQPAGDAPAHALALSPAEIAYLGGGEDRLVYATVARLFRTRALDLDSATRKLATRGDEPPEGASKLERAIFAAVKGDPTATLSKLGSVASWTLDPIRRRLEDLGLILTGRQSRAVIWAPLVLVLLVPVFGVVKIFVGIYRDRPVLFLVGFCVVSAAVAVLAFSRSPRRSLRGDRALARLQSDNAAVEYQAARRADRLSADDLVLAMGLFGMNVLSEPPLSDLKKALAPPPLPEKPDRRDGGGACSSGSSWSWFSCSSCGSGSSCGGGGSCGGGCGGGGCGGCGS
jgi:uncharacterized protein (TIGR04222 family)